MRTKLIAIGDIHGREIWKDIVNQNTDANKFVFIGDYFDNADINGNDQANNFLDICQFKKDNWDKVVMLLGNHDFHYLNIINKNTGNITQYSGYNAVYSIQFTEILNNALRSGLIDLCYAHHQKTLFSHAGLTQTWCNENNIRWNKPLNSQLAKLYMLHPDRFDFRSGRNFDKYGDDITQGPLWVRLPSLSMDKLPGFIQVVGHTRQKEIKGCNFLYDDIVCIDALEWGKYLVVENNILREETILK